jgi:hypothetical protein
MASTEWYYAHDGQQAGPVSALELKQLADAGKLRPDDLVWQEGMKDWSPARKVKGLFEPKQVAAAVAPSVAAPPVVAASAGKPSDRPPSGIERVAVAAVERVPVERPVASEQPVVTVPRAPLVGPSERVARPHVVEVLLAGIARRTGRPFVEAASLLFTRAGHWGCYAAMLGSFGLGVAFAVKSHDYLPLVAQVVVLPALVIFQYLSRRFLLAGARLAHTGGAKIGSPALLEACALGAMVIGLASLVGMTVLAMQTRLVWIALPGLGGFIVFEYLAIVALSPESLGLSVDPEAGLADETIGVLSLIVMALFRLAPVLWGVGVLWGAFEVVLAAVSVFSHANSLWPTLGWSAPVLGLLTLSPLWVYLKLLVYHLLVALVRAVLATPERLERIAERSEG